MIGNHWKNRGFLLGGGAVSALVVIGWLFPSLKDPSPVNTPVERAVFSPLPIQTTRAAPEPAVAQLESAPVKTIYGERSRTGSSAPVRPRKWYQPAVHKPSPTSIPAVQARTQAPAIPAPSPAGSDVEQDRPRLKQRPVATTETGSADQQARSENRPPVRRAPVVVERSKEKSIAIMAGSAALGAAIGAIAGHGKGAAIGALSGGVIGAVYDRMTRRRTVDPDGTDGNNPVPVTRNVFP